MSLIEVFSRMHSEGFSFYFGGLGVELCSLDAAFASAKLFATVRGEDAMAVPMGSAAKAVTL